MIQKKTSALFKIIKWLLKKCYPKIEVVGTENLPDEPCIVVGNHTQMHSPLACELYFPVERYTWCAGQMMHVKEVPAYAFEDFWSFKPSHTHWYFKLLAYAIAPLSAVVFGNANTIPVYRDIKIVSTFRQTMEKLDEGGSIVIFPEKNEKYNNIIYNFQDGFIDVARLYHRRTGKELSFVPLYVAPKLHRMYLGKPIRFNSAEPFEQERARIREYLMAEITDIARSLPRHIVVPYRNIPKKDYPYNIPSEVNAHEETGC